jgi:hypothetical protein
MEIDATKSAVGSDEEGIPISIAPNGDVIRSPRIDTQRAQTTVMAASGQTVILGGLITKRVSQVHRQLPWLGDLPYLGRLFSFDTEQEDRTELMIIMTPHVVRRESDNDVLKQVEAARMSWCMADVYRVHGPGGPKGLGLGGNEEVPIIYPDENPVAPEQMPGPEQNPQSILDGSSGAASGGNYVSPPVDVQPTPAQEPDSALPNRPLPNEPAQPNPLPMPTQPMTEFRRDRYRDEPRYESRYDAPFRSPGLPDATRVEPARYDAHDASYPKP